MAYATPTYDYGREANRLTLDKGIQDVTQDYGRFLSQERFRRGMSDANRQFKDRFPNIARGYNRRGMYNSGIRRGAQQQEAQEFQRQTDRFRQDYAAEQQLQEQLRAFGDARHQMSLNDLFENMQRQRAAGYDPFAAYRGGF